MKVSYLHMIWDVKILLAKIKDGKGRDLKYTKNKNLLRKLLLNEAQNTGLS